MTDDPGGKDKKALVSYAVYLPKEGTTVTVSPLTALFLGTAWGTDRLTRLVDSQTRLREAFNRLRTAELRGDNLEAELEQVFELEAMERADRYKTYELKISRSVMETELLVDEKLRRRQETLTEVARLQAEAREHDQRAVPPSGARTKERKETEDPALSQAIKRARQQLEIKKELARMQRDVEQQVAEGLFDKEEGKRVMADMEQLILGGLRSGRN